MRKLQGLLLVIVMSAVVFGGAATGSAGAKPVKTTLYLHGYSPLGEIDGIDWLANGSPPMAMTTAEPTEQIPRSMVFGVPGLNTSCTGLPTGFPTWIGNIEGTVVGDAKLTVTTVSTPANITARLWVDTPVFLCNESFVRPHSEVIVEVPPGQNEVEIVFPKLRLKAKSLILVELLGTALRGRVFYDSPSMPSALTFKCVPARGKSCV